MGTVKHFSFDTSVKEIAKEDIAIIEEKKTKVFKEKLDKKRELTSKRLESEQFTFTHVEGRIIVSIDLDGKNSHTFEDGTKIYVGRQFNNLNRRETEPVNAIVIDSEYIPKGVEILIHPNAIHDSNRIFGYANRGVEEGNSLRYYSIEETSAFVYKDECSTWRPLKGYVTALRLFKPYEGTLKGILPKKIENVLYITSGEFKGMCVHTLKACDYEIIFMDTNGKENRVVRARHYEDEHHDREELTCIDYVLTEKVNKGEILVGLSESDCKTFHESHK